MADTILTKAPSVKYFTRGTVRSRGSFGPNY